MAPKTFLDSLSNLTETKTTIKQKVQPKVDPDDLPSPLAQALTALKNTTPELNEDDENEAPDFVNLPTIVCPPLAQAGEHSSDEEINRQHLQMSNLELNVIYAMWPQVNSITSVCKLIDASIKAVKHQRDLLCLPYGYRGEATRKDIVFPPIDD